MMGDGRPTGEVEVVLSNCCWKAGTLGRNEAMPLFVIFELVRLQKVQETLC